MGSPSPGCCLDRPSLVQPRAKSRARPSSHGVCWTEGHSEWCGPKLAHLPHSSERKPHKSPWPVIPGCLPSRVVAVCKVVTGPPTATRALLPFCPVGTSHNWRRLSSPEPRGWFWRTETLTKRAVPLWRVSEHRWGPNLSHFNYTKKGKSRTREHGRDTPGLLTWPLAQRNLTAGSEGSASKGVKRVGGDRRSTPVMPVLTRHWTFRAIPRGLTGHRGSSSAGPVGAWEGGPGPSPNPPLHVSETVPSLPAPCLSPQRRAPR